jgi:D-aspartate ligase
MLVKSNNSVILASPHAGGTLAAVRSLGRAGIDVRIISSKIFSAAAWSQYVSKTYSAVPETDDQGFLKNLVAIGVAEPGHMLLPTSDHTAWLYTENAAMLRQYFRIYQPSASTMRRILDKKLLAEAAVEVGIPVLESWYPRNLEEVMSIASSLPYPILIKPRTQLYRPSNDKGMNVNSANELISYCEKLFKGELKETNGLLRDANIILQRFVGGASQVHSISGFIDRTGELFVTRHSAKVFQRSQPVGVGVCFESLPSNPMLADSVRNLCRELNFFGIFEVEFLWFEGRWSVIDFNPRLFSQVGMDVERGLPLPLFAYLDAAGQTEALRVAVEQALAYADDLKVVFYDRFTLAALLLAQSLTSRILPSDRAYWRAWKRANAHAVDFAFDRNDPRPGIVHAISEIYLGFLAFPRFLRLTPRIPKVWTHVFARKRA